MNHIFNFISFGDIGSYFDVLLSKPIIIVIAVVILLVITFVIIMATKPKKNKNNNGNMQNINNPYLQMDNNNFNQNMMANGLNNSVNQDMQSNLGSNMNLNNNVDNGFNNNINNLNVNPVVQESANVNPFVMNNNDGNVVNTDNSLNLVNNDVSNVIEPVSNEIVQPIVSDNSVINQIPVEVVHENPIIDNSSSVDFQSPVLEVKQDLNPIEVVNSSNEIELPQAQIIEEQPIVNNIPIDTKVNNSEIVSENINSMAGVSEEVIKPVEFDMVSNSNLENIPIQELQSNVEVVPSEIKIEPVINEVKEEFNVNQEPEANDVSFEMFSQNVAVPSNIAPVVEPVNVEVLEAPSLESFGFEPMPPISEEKTNDNVEPENPVPNVGGETMSFNNMFEATQKIDISTINNHE